MVEPSQPGRYASAAERALVIDPVTGARSYSVSRYIAACDAVDRRNPPTGGGLIAAAVAATADTDAALFRLSVLNVEALLRRDAVTEADRQALTAWLFRLRAAACHHAAKEPPHVG